MLPRNRDGESKFGWLDLVVKVVPRMQGVAILGPLFVNTGYRGSPLKGPNFLYEGAPSDFIKRRKDCSHEFIRLDGFDDVTAIPVRHR